MCLHKQERGQRCRSVQNRPKRKTLSKLCSLCRSVYVYCMKRAHVERFSVLEMCLHGSAKVKALNADSEVCTACLTNCPEKGKLTLKVSVTYNYKNNLIFLYCSHLMYSASHFEF